MKRVAIYITLIVAYAAFSAMVYTSGTENQTRLADDEMVMAENGKKIFQEKNCISCHQLYGLGGYLGPDLTKAYTDKHRGEAYMRAILRSGGNRMPAYSFTAQEINSIIAYLKYVDTTATPVKAADRK